MMLGHTSSTGMFLPSDSEYVAQDVRQYSDDAATRHFCVMTERILRMRLERMSLAGHPFIMFGFSFHNYCT